MDTNGSLHIHYSSLQKFTALLIACLAGLTIMDMPFIFGAIIEKLNVSPSEATWATSTEIALVALSSIFVSVKLERLNPRIVAFTGTLLVVLGQAFTIYSNELITMIASRALVGVGEGLCMGIGFASLAQSKGGQKLLLLSSGLMSALGLASFVAIPPLMEVLGSNTVFWTILCVAIVSVPLTLTLSGRKLEAIADVSNTQLKKLSTRSILLFLLSFFFSVGSNTLWLYLDQIGINIQLSQATIGLIGALGLIAGVLAPILTNSVFKRTKTATPLIVLCIASGIASYFNATTSSAVIFATTIACMGFTYSAFLAHIRMYSAHFDETGRSTAATSGADSLGMVLGPIAASLVLDLSTSLAGLSVFAVIAQLSSVIVCGYLILHSRRADRGQLAASA